MEEISRDPRIRDFVSIYRPPKTPAPFFGFIMINHGNRGWIKKKHLKTKRLTLITEL